jgi:hypothetical protein
VYRVLTGRPEEKWALAKPWRGSGIILKRNLRKYYGIELTGYIWLRLWKSGDCCEDNNEHSYVLKSGEYLV